MCVSIEIGIAKWLYLLAINQNRHLLAIGTPSPAAQEWLGLALLVRVRSKSKWAGVLNNIEELAFIKQLSSRSQFLSDSQPHQVVRGETFCCLNTAERCSGCVSNKREGRRTSLSYIDLQRGWYNNVCAGHNTSVGKLPLPASGTSCCKLIDRIVFPGQSPRRFLFLSLTVHTLCISWYEDLN